MISYGIAAMTSGIRDWLDETAGPTGDGARGPASVYSLLGIQLL